MGDKVGTFEYTSILLLVVNWDTESCMDSSLVCAETTCFSWISMRDSTDYTVCGTSSVSVIIVVVVTQL